MSKNPCTCYLARLKNVRIGIFLVVVDWRHELNPLPLYYHKVPILAKIRNGMEEMQESRSLMSIDDSFKKIIIVKDHIVPRRNEEGILTIGLFDFLLKENSLDL